MSQQPPTPVMPSSALNNTPVTLDPDLRSLINTMLLRDRHVTKIQEALIHALNSNSANWPTQILTHALNLLRSGEINTYPALLRRVLDDIREASTLNPSSTNSKTPNGDAKKVKGSTTADNKQNLAVPNAVIENAFCVTRESLEAVCEIDDHGAS